jgi:serine/threonine-protein kinase RsbW/stage II sporulation protein AB (anti-sigma F factor)
VSSLEVFDQVWTAVPDNVPLARHAVLGHLREATPDPPLSDIGLAISEAATNVVHHAYVDAETPGPFRVRVEVRETDVEVVVEDEGTGMVPRPDTPGLGLGMPLIATVASRFDVRTTVQGGTRLCIWFDTDPGAATLPA